MFSFRGSEWKDNHKMAKSYLVFYGIIDSFISALKRFDNARKSYRMSNTATTHENGNIISIAFSDKIVLCIVDPVAVFGQIDA